MKKLLILLVAAAISVSATAQIKQVTLQASGLTCSMCSNSIYKALQKIAFVNNVSPNIKESSYTITFKDHIAVDFDVLKKSVEDAGFSVAKMKVVADFMNELIESDTHITLDGKALHFVGVKPQILNGEQTFQIVDKNFVTDKVYKKHAAATKMQCIKTGYMASCCKSSKSGAMATRIYHVTV